MDDAQKGLIIQAASNLKGFCCFLQLIQYCEAMHSGQSLPPEYVEILITNLILHSMLDLSSLLRTVA